MSWTKSGIEVSVKRIKFIYEELKCPWILSSLFLTGFRQTIPGADVGY